MEHWKIELLPGIPNDLKQCQQYALDLIVKLNTANNEIRRLQAELAILQNPEKKLDAQE